MAEPLKNNLNKQYLITLGQALQAICPSVSPTHFALSCQKKDWEELRLKQRLSRISECLQSDLPGPYKANLKLLYQVAPSFGGFEALYFPEYVEKFGREKKDRKASLKALAHFTQFSSAEFAIRPFIVEDTDSTMNWLLKLSTHKNFHLRRLATEGCRPRLPWAQALPDFKKDPSLILPILENLREDPELYVRKSVANNLNDISKDHPDLAIKIARRWIRKGHPHTDWIVNHGLRTLIKAGHPEAMKTLGFNPRAEFEINDFSVKSRRLRLGDPLIFRFRVRNKSKNHQDCLLDYSIHHRKKNGSLQPKVFKLKKLRLAPNEDIWVEKIHKMVKISTRTYYSGQHFIQIQVNGRLMNKDSFHLKIEKINSSQDDFF